MNKQFYDMKIPALDTMNDTFKQKNSSGDILTLFQLRSGPLVRLVSYRSLSHTPLLNLPLRLCFASLRCCQCCCVFSSATLSLSSSTKACWLWLFQALLHMSTACPSSVAWQRFPFAFCFHHGNRWQYRFITDQLCECFTGRLRNRFPCLLCCRGFRQRQNGGLYCLGRCPENDVFLVTVFY